MMMDVLDDDNDNDEGDCKTATHDATSVLSVTPLVQTRGTSDGYPMTQEDPHVLLPGTWKVLACMVVIGLAACTWCAVVMQQLGVSAADIAINILLTSTAIVPPAIPGCIAIATSLSIKR